MRTHVTAMMVTAGISVSVIAGVANAGPPSPISGTIELNSAVARSAALSYGSNVSFTAALSGRLDSKGYAYITTVCRQGDTVVYQWSTRDLGFAFPLVDQDGQGLEWNGESAACEAYLTYRIDRKNGDVIQTLDSVAFDVG